MVEENKGQASLEALWALNLLDGLTADRAAKWIRHADPHVRRNVIKLMGDPA